MVNRRTITKYLNKLNDKYSSTWPFMSLLVINISSLLIDFIRGKELSSTSIVTAILAVLFISINIPSWLKEKKVIKSTEVYVGKAAVYVWNVADSPRHQRFNDILEKSHLNATIMGGRMGNISTRTEFLRRLFEGGVHVRILMCSPAVYKTLVECKNYQYNKYLGQSSEENYISGIESSKSNLISFINDLAVKHGCGSVELREYTMFLPFNYTYTGQNGFDELILEVALPYSNKYLAFDVRSFSDDEAKKIIDMQFAELWKKSHILAQKNTEN